MQQPVRATTVAARIAPTPVVGGEQRVGDALHGDAAASGPTSRVVAQHDSA